MLLKNARTRIYSSDPSEIERQQNVRCVYRNIKKGVYR